MALELKLSVTSRADDGKTILLSDTTGTYDATTNPGGYGAPNEERASLNLVFLADYVKGGQRTSAGYSVASETTWTITTDSDCLYEFLLVAASSPTAQTYSKDKVVYNDGKLYKAVTETTYTGTTDLADCKKWKHVQLITDYPLLASTGATHVLQPYVHTVYTEICIAKSTLSLSRKGVESHTYESLAKNWLWAMVNFHAAKLSAGMADYPEAGRAIEEAYESCTFNCGC